MYMQAIYIEPEYRRQGIAKEAMACLAKLALDSKCSRIEWFVVRDNGSSHRFYESIGSHLLEHMAIRRVSDAELIALSNLSG